MWTGENSGCYGRGKLRYPSDLTDDEWGHVEPLLPFAKHGGVKRTVNLREAVNGLLYVLSTGCHWRRGRKKPVSQEHGYNYFDVGTGTAR